MSNLNETFNIDDDVFAADDDFIALPAGDYPVSVTEAELKDTKSGTGQYIKMKLYVTDGEKSGRVLFSNLNIRNQNEIAEKIGKQQMGHVMRALGLKTLSDTDQLIGGNMIVKVKVKKDEQYGDAEGNVNEVVGYKSLNGSEAPAPKNTVNSPEKAAGGSKPPWAK